jgi:uncharacterized membrane protein
VVLLVRLGVALLLILSLAQLQFTRHSDLLSVLFALDLSDSVPFTQRLEAQNEVRSSLAKLGKRDQAGVVVFGRDAVLDTPVQPFLAWEKPNSVYESGGTNIAAGLRLALASLPSESQKRIVLFSDGNENRGGSLEEAERLAGLGVPVDVFPLEYRNEAEVYVEKIVHKNRLHEDEPIDIDVFVQSREDTPAKLRLLLDDQLLLEQPVQLRAGKNKFTVPALKLPTRQFYRLEARVEAVSDNCLENNRAGGFVSVLGKPNILLVEGDLNSNPAAAEEFAAQLQAEGINLKRIPPEDFSSDPAQLVAYDSVVLSNVDASELTQDQMEMLEKGAHDLGVGLVMVGGPRSFGAGGYRDTPVEKALPVSMEIKERKIIPSGALAIVLHTCEIMDGNNWMRQVAIESLRVLDAHDEVGMLDYEGNGVQWIFPMAPKGDGRRQIALIKSAGPGDMPDFETAMKLGYNGLITCSSVLKHMVILSDGDPSKPSDALIAQFASAGISISTVLIGGHGSDFRKIMSDIAKKTGGRFYEVTDPRSLPRIFAREAARIKRNLVVEEPFQPNLVAETELTESFSPGDYPGLLGYVITTPKPGADIPLVTHQEDPLLAHWRYGLGRAVAFTSDFKKKWGPSWIEWEGYGKFWAQVVRWVSRRQMGGDYRVGIHQKEGKGRVTLEAFDDQGSPLNYLEFEGRALSPDNQSVPFRLVQTGLGSYEGEFEVDREGTYVVNLAQTGEGKGEGAVLTTGLAVPYSPEYSNDRSNTRLLKSIAERTKGRVSPGLDSLFDHTLVAHAKPFPLWPWLLGIAVILFWIDVFVRRVLVEWADVILGFQKALAWLGPGSKTPAESTLERLKQTKEAALRKRAEAPREGLPGSERFDFDALESRQAEGIDLAKPEGRKAAPQKHDAPLSREPAPGEAETQRTTSRLLDLKKKKDKE